jgi:hypothetical protein
VIVLAATAVTEPLAAAVGCTVWQSAAQVPQASVLPSSQASAPEETTPSPQATALPLVPPEEEELELLPPVVVPELELEPVLVLELPVEPVEPAVLDAPLLPVLALLAVLALLEPVEPLELAVVQRLVVG